MSHEMRTPLTAISGFAELLIDEQEIPEQHKHHIKTIYDEAEKLAELVNRFLDVRRLKIDRARVDYEHFPVRDLLQKAQANTRDCKEHHIVQVLCQTDSNVYGNRKELCHVVKQLLENACRYSPQGGDIYLTAQSNAKNISICVTDQGIGIPKHEQEAIFSPFHRLDTGDTRTTGGIGLGLCLAREIIILHGGTIKVESTPGEGSSFTVILPQSAGKVSLPDFQDASTVQS
jgi:signal transduction histidine kinase